MTQHPDSYSGLDGRRREELSDFLRSRRAAVTPEEVGLRSTGRRRTPGLRREEVAELADVGLSWYTWLEQGRDISASVQVLDALARALLLTPGEREHLLKLAGATPAGPPKPTTPGGSRIDGELVAMVAALAPHPAFVLDERFDVVAHNPPAELVMHDLLTAPLGERNLLLWLFRDREAWSGVEDGWSRTARANLLDFRTVHADHAGDPAFDELLAELRKTGEPFGAWWAEHDVAPLEPTRKRFPHPELGELRMLLLQSHLVHTSHRLRILVPADDRTRAVMTERYT